MGYGCNITGDAQICLYIYISVHQILTDMSVSIKPRLILDLGIDK